MSLWHRLLYWLGLRRDPGPRYYTLDERTDSALQSIAARQRRSPQEVASQLLTVSLTQQQTTTGLWRRWLSLSPREQQVTALTCLGLTNPQIAARLGVSIETVRTHLRNAQYKFHVTSKADLRVLLADWDFGAWGEM